MSKYISPLLFLSSPLTSSPLSSSLLPLPLLSSPPPSSPPLLSSSSSPQSHRISCVPGCAWTHYAARNDLEFLLLLPQSLRLIAWDCRHWATTPVFANASLLVFACFIFRKRLAENPTVLESHIAQQMVSHSFVSHRFASFVECSLCPVQFCGNRSRWHKKGLLFVLMIWVVQILLSTCIRILTVNPINSLKMIQSV